MYIEIKVYLGDDEFSDLYEKETARSFDDAEGELGRIGRHYAKDTLDGKFDEFDRSARDYEEPKGQEETNKQ